MHIKHATLSLLLPLLLSVTWNYSASAAQNLELTWSGGDDIPVTVYPAEGDLLLLMLPSGRGLSPRQAPLAEGLAQQGIETWVVDLHGALFLPPGSQSLREVPAGMVADLIQQGVGTGKQVVVMSTGRGAALVLEGAQRWQFDHPGQRGLGGAILFHPDLYRLTPQGGVEPEFIPVTDAIDLPIYIFQPMKASARWYLNELVERLQAGGSDVLVQLLPKVGNGFHLRPQFNEIEAKTSARLPALIKQALKLLAPYTRNRDAVDPPAARGSGLGAETLGAGAELKRFGGNPGAPPLRLADLQGIDYDLDQFRGHVVLVNFWATWCPPCIKEIPSMQRLSERLARDDFVILTVDVGEDEATVKTFMAQFKVNFAVLMDPDGVAVRQWRVYAFPTSFVIDRKGVIRYSLFGALEWDAPTVITRIEDLLQER